MNIIQSTPFWHWASISWLFGIIITISLLTKYWHKVWEIAILYNAGGWMCALYAGMFGTWFIGWFAWVIILSTVLFMRYVFQRIENIGDDRG